MLRFDSLEQCRAYMEENSIRQFDIKFCDLIGSWHHITLMRESVDTSMIEKGVGFDSSSIPRFRDVRSGDMSARPDLTACFLDTTFDVPTLSSIGDIVEAGSGEETPLDPRSVLKRAVAYLRKTGIADTFVCAPELEFYLFAEANFHNDPYEAFYRLGAPGVGRPISADTVAASERLMENRGYLAAHPQDCRQNDRAIMASRIAEAGFPVRYHHVEVGAAGQQEIELGFSPALTTADGILVSKYIIRYVAVDRGIEACFMPKPIADAAGNGLHIHFRLLKDGNNLFAGDGYGGLSDLAKHFLGGVLSHGRSVLAFTSPTTNSYRRLRPGNETPVRFFYSVANREAAVRIPKYATGRHARCEFRPGDAMMNPYLAIAALLMAGIDGVKNQIDPTPERFGPFDGIPPEINPEDHPQCFLPDNLQQALASPRNDHAFLLECDTFDETLLYNYINYKHREELNLLSRAPHPLEYEMYWGL